MKFAGLAAISFIALQSLALAIAIMAFGLGAVALTFAYHNVTDLHAAATEQGRRLDKLEGLIEDDATPPPSSSG